MPPAEANFQGLRRQVAVALRGGHKRTLFETSKVLGKRSGDIQRTVRQMHTEDLLKADDAEPVRGTHFWFNEEEYGPALDEFLESDRPPGQLFFDQRLLIVAPKTEEDPLTVLARDELVGEIAWTVEWGGDGEMLIGLEKEAPKRAADQLVAAFRKAGMSCIQKRVGEVLGVDETRRHVASIDYLVKQGDS